MFKIQSSQLLKLLILFVVLTDVCCAQQRNIAITMDDLPLLYYSPETFDNILNSFIKHKVPATGFVIGNRVNPDTTRQLILFQKNGFMLGSHSYSHTSLRELSVEDYIEDVAKADKILAPFMSSPKYYRYPYLAEGRWWWTRNKVKRYLSDNHYLIAPVTIDSRDFEFNAELLDLQKQQSVASLDLLKKRYLEFVWNQTLKAEKNESGKAGKQILLIHANLLNSYFLDDLLSMFEAHGYHFISLNEALA